MRRSLLNSLLAFAVLASTLFAREFTPRTHHPKAQKSQQQTEQQAPPQQSSPQQTPSPSEVPPLQETPSQTAQTPPPPPVRLGPVVVLDPGHGGTDSGARGTSGAVEKDVVLQFARSLRAELERLGYRVVMTRNDDSNPSYDDRAAMVNVYRDATFISIHVASTGKIGTARVYYYQFPTSAPTVANSSATLSSTSSASTPSSPPEPAPFRSSLIPWEEEQRPFADPSHRLANLVQIELTHRFANSPNAPAPVAVRSLRSVAAPAIAVEISSVSVEEPEALTSLAGPLASSVARGVAAFHPIAAPSAGAP